MGLEPIPMGYIVVEPGMKVGEVGMANVIKEGEDQRAVGCALAAQYLGMKLVYLEAGSGASHPVFPDIIKSVKATLDVPLIVGGGIRTPEQAAVVVKNQSESKEVGTSILRRKLPSSIGRKPSYAEGIRGIPSRVGDEVSYESGNSTNFSSYNV